jgi:hypothetical protein
MTFCKKCSARAGVSIPIGALLFSFRFLNIDHPKPGSAWLILIQAPAYALPFTPETSGPLTPTQKSAALCTQTPVE